MINEISDFCRQYQYLQLKKPSGVEVEIPVHKALTMDLLKGGPTGPPLGLIGLRGRFAIHKTTIINSSKKLSIPLFALSI